MKKRPLLRYSVKQKQNILSHDEAHIRLNETIKLDEGPTLRIMADLVSLLQLTTNLAIIKFVQFQSNIFSIQKEDRRLIQVLTCSKIAFLNL